MVTVSWLILLVSAGLWQTQQGAVDKQYDLIAGKILPTAELLAADSTFRRMSLFFLVGCTTAQWLVKFSLIVFARRLSSNVVRWHRVWWWCVLLFNLATFVIIQAARPYDCLLGSLEYSRSRFRPAQLFSRLF